MLLMTYEWGYTYSEPMAVAPLNSVDVYKRQVQSKPKDAVKSLADSAAPAAQSEAATAVTQPDSPAVSASINTAERRADTDAAPAVQSEPAAAEAAQPVPPKMHDPVNKACLLYTSRCV